VKVGSKGKRAMRTLEQLDLDLERRSPEAEEVIEETEQWPEASPDGERRSEKGVAELIEEEECSTVLGT